MNKNKTIIFIVSAGHSGSTLLAKILGQHPEVFSGSELVNYNNKSVRSEKSLCSCKMSYSNCQFWGKIKSENDIDNLHLFSILKGNKKFGNFFKLIVTIFINSRFESSTINKNIEQYYRLYNSIFKESGSNIIVDASKNFFNAFILASQKKFNYKFIFIRRDGRAVLNSNLKSYYRVEYNGKTITHKSISKRNPTKIVNYWMKQNILGLLLLILRYNKTISIKHEGVVENTKEEMINLFKNLNLTWHDEIIDFNEIDHMFGGNASRINTKGIKKVDLYSWKKNLSLKQLKSFNFRAKLLNYILGYR